MLRIILGSGHFICFFTARALTRSFDKDTAWEGQVDMDDVCIRGNDWRLCLARTITNGMACIAIWSRASGCMDWSNCIFSPSFSSAFTIGFLVFCQMGLSAV